MAWYDEFVPMIIGEHYEQEKRSREVVSAEEWNNLFELNRAQGNHSEAYLAELNTYLFDEYAGKAATWDAKQDPLESGVTIKSINGESILGAGNLQITGEGVPSSTAQAIATSSSGGHADTYSRGDHVHNISGQTIKSALGYTPYNSSNPSGYISTRAEIVSKLGWDPSTGDKHHKSGSWSGRKYTAVAANSAPELSFTLPSGINIIFNGDQASTASVGASVSIPGYTNYKAILVIVEDTNEAGSMAPVLIPAEPSSATKIGFGTTAGQRNNTFITHASSRYISVTATTDGVHGTVAINGGTNWAAYRTYLHIRAVIGIY